MVRFSSHSIVSAPPRTSTVTFRPVLPFNTQAAAVAQHPVPQASVSPVPRSQTRILHIPGIQPLQTPCWYGAGSARGFQNAVRSAPAENLPYCPQNNRMRISHGNTGHPVLFVIHYDLFVNGLLVLETTGTSAAVRIGSPISTRIAFVMPFSTVKSIYFTFPPLTIENCV